MDNGINVTLITEMTNYSPFDGNIVQFPPQAISKDIMSIYVSTIGNFYYFGYWVKDEIVSFVKNILLQELVFPEISTVDGLPEIYTTYERIIKGSDSVGLHIRRGDFVECGRAVSIEKYARAVAEMESEYPGGIYYVFSDDIAWCKEHAAELNLTNVAGTVVFVEGNTEGRFNYVDMQLLSYCERMIISNSSFSGWAYYLRKTPVQKLIVADTM